jgi:hypothetical protein
MARTYYVVTGSRHGFSTATPTPPLCAEGLLTITYMATSEYIAEVDRRRTMRGRTCIWGEPCVHLAACSTRTSSAASAGHIAHGRAPGGTGTHQIVRRCTHTNNFLLSRFPTGPRSHPSLQGCEKYMLDHVHRGILSLRHEVPHKVKREQQPSGGSVSLL